MGDDCPIDKSCEVQYPLSHIQPKGYFCSDLHKIWHVLPYPFNFYVCGCLQAKVFIGEKDLKNYVKINTYRLIRAWDLTEQTEQVLRDENMYVAACL